MSLFGSLIQSRNRDTSDNESQLEQTIKPYYEINESKDGYALTVFLPGVTKEGLQLTAENNALRVSGRSSWKRPEGWTTLYNESAQVPYELAFEHDNSIDIEKIHAELRDGVLRVSLPKSEALKPRKISVS